MFGGLSLHLGWSGEHGSGMPADIPATVEAYGFLDYLSPVTFGLIGSSVLGLQDEHLMGQHTVRMSPISTARLNPDAQAFCLSPPDNYVLIPVLLNNTNTASLRYSLTPLGRTDNAKPTYHDMSARDIRAIESAREEILQLTRVTKNDKNDDDYDEYDDDEDHDAGASSSGLQRTQSFVHIKLSKPGTLRIERLMDTSGTAAKVFAGEVTVAPCPRAEFHPLPKDQDVQCAAQDLEMQMEIDISGVPPLSMRYSKIVNGRRELFMVEGVEGADSGSVPSSQQGAQSSLAVAERKFIQRIAAPQSIKVPLAATLETTGTHTYVLEEVTDAVGNYVRLGQGSPLRTSSSVTVLRRPAMSFKGCGPGRPTPVLIGAETDLSVVASEADAMDAPYKVTVKYNPPTDGPRRVSAYTKTWETSEASKHLSVIAKHPGEYTIVGVHGKYCEGDVLAPDVCTVFELPKPSADVEWEKIHECSGDTGVRAALLLHGTPPFQVFYQTQKGKNAPVTASKTFQSSREEIIIRPPEEGDYTFSVTHVSDANYRKEEVKARSIDQTIHPVAAAEFAGGGRRKQKMSICDSRTIDVDVHLRGTAPWDLELQIISPRGSMIRTYNGIDTSPKSLQIPIPDEVDKSGGHLEIDLVSVQDRSGCKRMLQNPGISVDVRRVKPTVKFYGSPSQREITVLERQNTRLPLRLTGDGPWTVKYRRMEAPNSVLTARLATPNDELEVVNKGTYELMSVTDVMCPGSVVADSSTYKVEWIPRPSAKLSENTVATYEPFNSSHILRSVCAGDDDSVDLDLSGRPPFQIMYNVAKANSYYGRSELIDQPTYNSIQTRTRFQLRTDLPGRMLYEVKQIGDVHYPLAKHKNATIPQRERLLIEQDVLARPTARFKSQTARMSYCVNDALTAQNIASDDGLVLLEGTPPFTLSLEVGKLGTVERATVEMTVHERTWKLSLPDYHFESVGTHRVTITSVSDAGGCAHIALDPLQTFLDIDVAETAAIVPFEKREDLCVGDITQFQLEGIPPWNIDYRINSRSHTQVAKTSPFALAQQAAGEFAVTGIAHQQQKCKAAVTDLRYRVHALPSAQVGHGGAYYDDIREGEQARIVFTLIGEPPFTFTYQRAELGRGGKPGRVLETHTVPRVMAHEYEILSNQEGIWTVTSITDKFCRYPPAQPDLTMDKRRG
ncbi:hypothetical protein BD626DRAFT_397603 [Schizophyllum amplum]|uniref:Nucleoporin Pom152 n=1 Tax=Schizophyllum amplum TaxID=97359 RepID=A0A550CMP2_9AGAR|nr:hypothetical protein BD626DRAFT_397603 [Auriculariopsis ampla]